MSGSLGLSSVTGSYIVMNSFTSKHSCIYRNPLANPKQLAMLRLDGTLHPEEQVSLASTMIHKVSFGVIKCCCCCGLVIEKELSDRSKKNTDSDQ